MSAAIIKQLQENDVTELRLSDADDDCIDDFRNIAEALAQNTSLTVVRLEGYLACLRNDARVEFVEAMTKNSSLQEIYVSDALLVVSCITNLIVKSKNLKVLSLHNVVLQGVQELFDNCERALLQHPSLKSFLLDEVKAAVDNIDTSKLVLAGKTKALATGPQAVHVKSAARSA